MEPTAQPTRLRSILGNIVSILIAVLLAYLIQTFVIRPFIVSGTSMVPDIQDGQYMIIDKISYRFHEPRRGDVIVFRALPEPSKYYIKRVIGLPGETVQLTGPTVRIINKEHPNGFTIPEPYVENQSSDFLTVTVPEGTYFVMGDNRAGSYDSRGWGPLPKEEISGRALIRLLPLNKISILPAKATYDESN